MSSIIDVVSRCENCINCEHSGNPNSADGLVCEYPHWILRVIFGKRHVKPDGWCDHFDAISKQNKKTKETKPEITPMKLLAQKIKGLYQKSK